MLDVRRYLAAMVLVVAAWGHPGAVAAQDSGSDGGGGSQNAQGDEYLVKGKDVDNEDDKKSEKSKNEDDKKSKKSGDKKKKPAAPGMKPRGKVEPEKHPETKRSQSEKQRRDEIQRSLERQIQTGQKKIHVYQLVEEIVDEVVADVRDLKAGTISPAAVRKMGLTPNLSKQFGDFVEATLVNALSNHTEVSIKRCVACQSLRSRIEDGNWVVSLGMTKQKQFRKEAERLGVKTFMDARFSYFPGANIVAMEIEFIRARDGAVMWSQTYRSDATTAAILRSGDRVKSRKERVKELERKIEERPYYGHQLYLGMANIPHDTPQGGITGASLGYRLYEEFGPDRRWRYGIGAEGFANFSSSPLLGSFIGATLQYDVIKPNLNLPKLRTGPMVSGFFAGQEG
ncbi:MAG: hypothetical protein ABEN55_02595, partial [Bradymonadaceae bacterium]